MARTTVGHVNDPGAVYIGRPTKFGSPFRKGIDGTRDECIAKHREWVYTQPELIAAIKKELKGKHLGCWCRPKKNNCHGDILAWIADEDDLFA